MRVLLRFIPKGQWAERLACLQVLSAPRLVVRQAGWVASTVALSPRVIEVSMEAHVPQGAILDSGWGRCGVGLCGLGVIDRTLVALPGSCGLRRRGGIAMAFRIIMSSRVVRFAGPA